MVLFLRLLRIEETMFRCKLKIAKIISHIPIACHKKNNTCLWSRKGISALKASLRDSYEKKEESFYNTMPH